MRVWLGLGVSGALIGAVAGGFALAQDAPPDDAPESLLPPGFDDPPPAEPAPPPAPLPTAAPIPVAPASAPPLTADSAAPAPVTGPAVLPPVQ